MTLRTRIAAAAALALALAVLPAAAAYAVPLPTGSVTGTVLDPSNNPVPGASVGISAASHSFNTTTAADGSFSFTNVPAGSYRLGYYIAPQPRSIVSTVVVPQGGVADLDLVMPNLSEITVTVTDGVNPLAGAFVFYSSDDYGVSNSPVYTGADGQFTVDSLPPGDYSVYVQGPQESDYVSEFYVDSTTLSGATPVVLPVGGTTQNLVIALDDSPYDVSGVVRRGVTPLDDASVQLYPGSVASYDPASPISFDVTDVTGAYLSTGLPNGTYTAIADWYDSVADEFYRSAPQQVVVSGGSATLDLEVTLAVDTPSVTTALPDAYTTPQDTVLTVPAPTGVLENDAVTPPDDEFEVGDMVQPSHGEVFLALDGALSYAPDTGFAGTDTFTYESGPDGQGSGPVTVTITVQAVLPATGSTPDVVPLAAALLALGSGIALVVVLRRRPEVARD